MCDSHDSFSMWSVKKQTNGVWFFFVYTPKLCNRWMIDIQLLLVKLRGCQTEMKIDYLPSGDKNKFYFFLIIFTLFLVIITFLKLSGALTVIKSSFCLHLFSPSSQSSFQLFHFSSYFPRPNDWYLQKREISCLEFSCWFLTAALRIPILDAFSL